MKRHTEDMHLWRRLDELDAELDASGVEDATEWEHWDEMENILMLLAERHVQRMERERNAAAAKETKYEDEVIELTELSEEAAMDELAAFGCIEFEPQFNWHAKSTPDDFGWTRAVIDIIAFEGEDAEPLLELF